MLSPLGFQSVGGYQGELDATAMFQFVGEKALNKKAVPTPNPNSRVEKIVL